MQRIRNFSKRLVEFYIYFAAFSGIIGIVAVIRFGLWKSSVSNIILAGIYTAFAINIWKFRKRQKKMEISAGKIDAEDDDNIEAPDYPVFNSAVWDEKPSREHVRTFEPPKHQL